MSTQRRLGKGIEALLQNNDLPQEPLDSTSVITVPLDRIHPNPDQPRKTFRQEALQELAQSIQERGVIQPILAEQREDGDYLIIAGERRWRAARLAGLATIPLLPGVFSLEEKLEIALIENIQRQDLSPLEEAQAYADLMERTGISQDVLARRLGKSRPAIANSLRLLKLPSAVQEKVSAGDLSAGHARTLLSLSDDASATMDEVARHALDEGFSVRNLERFVGLLNRGLPVKEAHREIVGGAVTLQGSEGAPSGTSPGDLQKTSFSQGAVQSSLPSRGGRKSVEMSQLEEKLIQTLGTRVLLAGSEQRGKIEISYLSMDDLERIAEIILGEGALPG
ncbi:chromosome segregation DNA-binding protein [Alkalispirochaeta americana]|uniref:Chromosome segregation DNA-binding protein n=1 Tax=Alkalispirochaeta americana TaxID=159291 RepID=A0A1N6QDB8_9SPIO|nr:ParB/RepB/Spo0J family partition protein [Alkalispirochaeta americana]SIQ14505.1 chromosome segregation DNA-binding protein [Alkalispirochaeta americana]